MAHLHQLKLKILARGQASRGGRKKASSEPASSGRLARRRRDQGRAPHEEPVTQAMTIETRRVPGGRLPTQCPCFPFGAKVASIGQASGKGYHSGATRPRPVERQDGCHHGAQDGVITSTFGSRIPPLVRITCTRCSPSKWPIVCALPAQLFGERPRASINRASHHRVGGHLEIR